MKIIILDEVDSTNEYLKKNYQKMEEHTCLQAICQTGGRGRRGHIWKSQQGNLTVSFLYRDILHIQEAWKYTMIAASSVIDMLGHYGIDASVKWPNDVYVGDDKICGILAETIFDPELKGIIVGIGVNVNDASPYISMKAIKNQNYDVHEVMTCLATMMEKHITLYQQGEFKKILDNLNHNSYLLGKWIQYQNHGVITFLRINEQGMAEYMDQNGKTGVMLVNEISLSVL